MVKKISLVTTMGRFPWAGSEELWYLTAQVLLEMGYQVKTVYPAKRGWAEQLGNLEEAGIEVESYGSQPGWLRSQRSRLQAKIIGRNSKIFPGPKPEDLGELVVVSQGGIDDGIPWLQELSKAGIPYVIICQANLDSYWPQAGRAKELRRLFGEAEACFFVSEDNLRLLQLQIGYAGKGEVVWNPLQPGTPDKIVDWPAEDGELRLAMVGRIEPFSKGHDLMLEVMSMSKWRRRPVSVTVFGRGNWRETLDHLLCERGLCSVRYGGFVSPEQIWADHHVLLLPSRHEGKSLAMLEAMWLGRPVVATDLAGATEEVIEGSTGFLAAAPTVALLDEALERVWQRRSELEAIGKYAAERLRRRMPKDPGRKLAQKISQIAGEIKRPSK